MSEEENLDLADLTDNNQALPPEEPGSVALVNHGEPPTNAKELEAVYDIPVQVAAVLGKANM